MQLTVHYTIDNRYALNPGENIIQARLKG